MALVLCPPTFSFTLYPERLMEDAFSLRPKLPCQGSCGHAALQCSLPRGHPLPLERCQITVASENTAQQFLTESHNENDFIAKRKKNRNLFNIALTNKQIGMKASKQIECT